MIVTCPACSTRYLVDPRALGVAGRSVRCTECAHVWPQVPAEDAPHRVDPPARDIEAAPPSPPPANPAAAAIVRPVPARRGHWSSAVIVLGVIVVLGLLWFGRQIVLGR
jgi:predicted Zn finger-like uncharacterized protein